MIDSVAKKDAEIVAKAMDKQHKLDAKRAIGLDKSDDLQASEAAQIVPTGDISHQIGEDIVARSPETTFRREIQRHIQHGQLAETYLVKICHSAVRDALYSKSLARVKIVVDELDAAGLASARQAIQVILTMTGGYTMTGDGNFDAVYAPQFSCLVIDKAGVNFVAEGLDAKLAAARKEYAARFRSVERLKPLLLKAQKAKEELTYAKLNKLMRKYEASPELWAAADRDQIAERLGMRSLLTEQAKHGKIEGEKEIGKGTSDIHGNRLVAD
jgi:hypothetical protein